jgi:hypothetical protein
MFDKQSKKDRSYKKKIEHFAKRLKNINSIKRETKK